MKLNKVGTLIIIVILYTGCLGKEKRNDKISQSNSLSEDKRLRKEIDSLDRATDISSIRKLKNKLDSVLRIDKNINVGYYYFQRADCYSSLELFEKANLDLEKAKQLNYLPERCDELMKFNETLLNIREKYN